MVGYFEYLLCGSFGWIFFVFNVVVDYYLCELFVVGIVIFD